MDFRLDKKSPDFAPRDHPDLGTSRSEARPVPFEDFLASHFNLLFRLMRFLSPSYSLWTLRNWMQYHNLFMRIICYSRATGILRLVSAETIENLAPIGRGWQLICDMSITGPGEGFGRPIFRSQINRPGGLYSFEVLISAQRIAFGFLQAAPRNRHLTDNGTKTDESWRYNENSIFCTQYCQWSRHLSTIWASRLVFPVLLKDRICKSSAADVNQLHTMQKFQAHGNSLTVEGM
jgi:hypothetical protein